MSLKNDLKNIVIDKQISGPFISLFLPLYPSENNLKLDKTELNSLLASAKKEFINKYGEKDWSIYEKQIKAAEQNIIFDYARSKTLAVILGKNTVYHYYLPRKVDLQVYVDDIPYILPIIWGYADMPTYNIAKISRSSFEMFTVKNGLIEKKNLDQDAPVSAKKVLNIDTPDQKIRIDQRSSNSTDQYRGNDVKSEAEDSNMDQYFKIIDEYITKHISLQDHLKVVLMATKEDVGEFNKLTHNPYLDTKNYLTIPSVINHTTLEKATALLNEKLSSNHQLKTEDLVETAQSQKKLIEGVQNIQPAAQEGRLDTVIINYQPTINQNEIKSRMKANQIAITTLIYGGQVKLTNTNGTNDQPIIGILRG